MASYLPYLAQWMAKNAGALADVKLRNICLPATHDSATSALTDVLSPCDKSVLYSSVDYLPVKGLCQATTQTVSEQLMQGIRCLDIRMYYNSSDGRYYAYHGLVGVALSSLLSSLRSFLSRTSGEIVYVSMSHMCPRGQGLYQGILDEWADALSEHLVAPVYDGDALQNNVFDMTYSQIVGSPPRSRVILASTYGYPWNTPKIWPVQFCPPAGGQEAPREGAPGIYGSYYKETTNVDDMIDDQQKKFKTAQEYNLPFALYMTLTPSNIDYAATVFCYLQAAGKWPPSADLFTHGLFNLSQKIDTQLDSVVCEDFWAPPGGGAGQCPISMIFLDYFESTNVVPLAIALTLGQTYLYGYRWVGNAPLSLAPASEGIPTQTTNTAPAIAALGQEVILAYENGGSIYYTMASAGGSGETPAWAECQQVTGCTTSSGASGNVLSMASLLEAMHLTYLGTDGSIMWVVYTKGQWSRPAPIQIASHDGSTTLSSQYCPSIAAFRDALYLAYADPSQSNCICVARYDPRDERWTSLGPIRSGSQTIVPYSYNSKSPSSLATLVTYNDELFLFYPLTDPSKDLAYAVYDGHSWTINLKITVSSNQKNPTPQSNYAPAAAVMGGLYLLYKGQGSETIYEAVYNGGTWLGNQPIESSGTSNSSPQSNYSPSAAATEGQLIMVNKAQDHNTIWGVRLVPPTSS